MRGSIFFKQKYCVRGAINSEHYISVFVDYKDIDILGEQQAVGHAAWIELWENEKDEDGVRTDRPSHTARVLRKLCQSVGTDDVKKKFISSIVFQKVKDDQAS